MAKTILATNQKETPKANILDGNWYGRVSTATAEYTLQMKSSCKQTTLTTLIQDG